MLAYYLSVFGLLATMLSTFRTDQPRFEFSKISPLAVSPCKTLHTNETLTCTNDMTRLANAHEYGCHNTLKPTWQDLSALNFDICGRTGVIIVVPNKKFKLVCFVHQYLRFLYSICISRFQCSNIHLHNSNAPEVVLAAR